MFFLGEITHANYSNESPSMCFCRPNVWLPAWAAVPAFPVLLLGAVLGPTFGYLLGQQFLYPLHHVGLSPCSGKSSCTPCTTLGLGHCSGNSSCTPCTTLGLGPFSGNSSCSPCTTLGFGPFSGNSSCTPWILTNFLLGAFVGPTFGYLLGQQFPHPLKSNEFSARCCCGSHVWGSSCCTPWFLTDVLLGAVVGPTFGCLLGQQFQILKLGDRFWYENNIPPSAFTKGISSHF